MPTGLRHTPERSGYLLSSNADAPVAIESAMNITTMGVAGPYKVRRPMRSSQYFAFVLGEYTSPDAAAGREHPGDIFSNRPGTAVAQLAHPSAVQEAFSSAAMLLSVLSRNCRTPVLSQSEGGGS